MLILIAHFLVSSIIGTLFWVAFGEKNKAIFLYYIFFSLLAGFFVDIDHLFDYVMAYGFVWNFGRFIHESYFNDSGHNFVLLHDFELVFLLGLIAFFIKNKKWRLYFTVMAISLFLHMITDILIANAVAEEYFLIYRIFTGFKS